MGALITLLLMIAAGIYAYRRWWKPEHTNIDAEVKSFAAWLETVTAEDFRRRQPKEDA